MDTTVRQTDYLIIGQGLAGTLLSYHLYKAGISHLVVDKIQTGSASRAAAGLINPVVIKRMVKTWQADLFLPYAISTYKAMEKLLKKRFFYSVPIHKIFGEDDPSFWTHQIGKEGLQGLVEIPDAAQRTPEKVKTPWGYGQILQSGRLNMTRLLDAYRSFLQLNHQLVETLFEVNDLKIEENHVCWKNIKARKIIFCRGAWDKENPFLNHFKFRNTKGELFDAEISGLKSEAILSKGIFVMPVGGANYKLGATYAHNWEDLNPSEQKKQELLSKWQKISDLPITIHRQITGIRPTLHDRRPVVGFLLSESRVGVFNGLGSRGGIQAPYLANELVKMIQDPNYKSFPEIALERYH